MTMLFSLQRSSQLNLVNPLLSLLLEVGRKQNPSSTIKISQAVQKERRAIPLEDIHQVNNELCLVDNINGTVGYIVDVEKGV